MAVLIDADRAAGCGDYQRNASALRDQFGALTKADLQAAFNGLDDYVSANQAAINQAVPLPARTALTTAQKARLLMYVVERRYLKGV